MPGSVRVGRLLTLGRAVYQRADGTLWYRADGRRKPVHGAHIWVDHDGRRMRGTQPLDLAFAARAGSPRSPSPEQPPRFGPDEDLELQAALLASLGAAHVPAPQLEPPAPAPAPLPAAAAAVDCLICMEPLVRGQAVRALPCAHSFHAACIQRWMRTNATCAVCRERA